MIVGVPLAIGGSIGALRRAPDRGFALTAVVISIAEAAALAVWAGLALFGSGTV